MTDPEIDVVQRKLRIVMVYAGTKEMVALVYTQVVVIVAVVAAMVAFAVARSADMIYPDPFPDPAEPPRASSVVILVRSAFVNPPDKIDPVVAP